MGALATAVRIRHDLHSRLIGARARTDEVFQVVREEAMYDRPIAERHRIIFYLGHVEAFDWNLLSQRAFGLRPFHPGFDQLFAFGIDPVGGGLPTDKPADWPTREEVERYNHRLREELDHAIEHALQRPEEGHPQLISMLEVAIEHRLMHGGALAVEGFETRVWVIRDANDPRRMKAQAMSAAVVARLTHASLVTSR